jgi:cytochrome c peroxidase
MRNAIILLMLALVTFSCKQQETEQPWQVVMPSNFPAPPGNLAITRGGFELGRKLFYDPQLSRDNTVSCGSCHISTSAFTQHGHSVSHGIDNLLGRRNSLPVQNLLWEPRYFWDGGVHNLELVPLTAITNPVEMDEEPAKVLEKIKNDPKYPPLFQAAYGTSEVTSTRFLMALAQFMGTLISANSKYDQVQRKENNAAFTPEEAEGYELFKAKCASCHQEPLFTDFTFRDNGLDKNYDLDRGRYEVSLDSADLGTFRVPSLRNLRFTKPYTHNGKKLTLEAMLDHYSSGMAPSLNLDPVFIQPNGQLGIPMTQQEKTRIIAFLKTLDDEEFVRNPDFAEQ